jgi:hypothetical protein
MAGARHEVRECALGGARRRALFGRERAIRTQGWTADPATRWPESAIQIDDAGQLKFAGGPGQLRALTDGRLLACQPAVRCPMR